MQSRELEICETNHHVYAVKASASVSPTRFDIIHNQPRSAERFPVKCLSFSLLRVACGTEGGMNGIG